MINYYSEQDKLVIAVDCIVFGFDDEGLKILLTKRDMDPERGKWSLMGTFLKNSETLLQAANRGLKNLTGLHDVYMDHLNAFSEIDRDPGARTISIAYYALINIKDHDEELSEKHSAQWFSINDFPKLIFDHNTMVKGALEMLRYKAYIKPIGFELLPKKFTMLQLQNLYEAIFSTSLDKRNFRKRILALNVLVKLDEKNMDSSKKGSFLYVFDEDKI